MTEVMAQDQTDKRYFDELVDFANDIRMLALPVNKGKERLPAQFHAGAMAAFGPRPVCHGRERSQEHRPRMDAWHRRTQRSVPRIRYGWYQTAYNIVMQYQKVPGLVSPLLKKMMMPYNFKAMASVLKQMLSEGKLGESSGEGFFKY